MISLFAGRFKRDVFEGEGLLGGPGLVAGAGVVHRIAGPYPGDISALHLLLLLDRGRKIEPCACAICLVVRVYEDAVTHNDYILFGLHGGYCKSFAGLRVSSDSGITFMDDRA